MILLLVKCILADVCSIVVSFRLSFSVMNDGSGDEAVTACCGGKITGWHNCKQCAKPVHRQIVCDARYGCLYAANSSAGRSTASSRTIGWWPRKMPLSSLSPSGGDRMLMSKRIRRRLQPRASSSSSAMRARTCCAARTNPPTAAGPSSRAAAAGFRSKENAHNCSGRSR